MEPPSNKLNQITAHVGPVHALAWSGGSGTYILTGGSDRGIRLFNASGASTKVKTLRPAPTTTLTPPIASYAAHSSSVLALSVRSDNAAFLSGGADKAVFLWDVTSDVRSPIRRFAGHAGRVNAVTYAGTSSGVDMDSVVFSASFDGTVRAWDIRSRSEREVLRWSEAKDSVECLAVKYGRIWAGSADGKARCYDLSAGKVLVDVFPGSVTGVVPTEDAAAVLVGCVDGGRRLMDVAKGTCLRTFENDSLVNSEFKCGLAFAAAEKWVLGGDEEGKIAVWDTYTGDRKEVLWHCEVDEAEAKRGKAFVSAIATNDNAGKWASAGGDGKVIIWGS